MMMAIFSAMPADYSTLSSQSQPAKVPATDDKTGAAEEEGIVIV